MKIFAYFVFGLAVLLIAINAWMLDFNNLFQGDSMVGLIGIVASLCAIVIMLIFVVSKKIQDKTNS
ncbi:MAG: hypothetical protein ACK4JX_00220 [Flavobacterium sp.]|jgi:hypothetical protein|nr:hypothetical protein [Flavobacteriales bacterium]